MRDDNGAGPKGSILGSGLGPWLISDRPKGWEWESFARRQPTERGSGWGRCILIAWLTQPKARSDRVSAGLGRSSNSLKPESTASLSARYRSKHCFEQNFFSCKSVANKAEATFAYLAPRFAQ